MEPQGRGRIQAGTGQDIAPLGHLFWRQHRDRAVKPGGVDGRDQPPGGRDVQAVSAPQVAHGRALHHRGAGRLVDPVAQGRRQMRGDPARRPHGRFGMNKAVPFDRPVSGQGRLGIRRQRQGILPLPVKFEQRHEAGKGRQLGRPRPRPAEEAVVVVSAARHGMPAAEARRRQQGRRQGRGGLRDNGVLDDPRSVAGLKQHLEPRANRHHTGRKGLAPNRSKPRRCCGLAG